MDQTRASGPPVSPVRRARHSRLTVAAIAAAFGLLLWAKLILVTSHPRTALADPDEQTSQAVEPAGESLPAEPASRSR